MSKIISVILAITFSFFVFVGMTVLIEPEVMAVEAEETRQLISITVEEEDDDPIRRKRILPKEPEEPEEPKLTKTTIESDKPEIRVAVADFRLPTNVNGDGFNMKSLPGLMGGGGNGEATPRVRINPTYPRGAAQDNIEGYVTLSFDISEMGRPVNVSVIDAKPRGVFERSARRALKKWKYDPKKVDNKAVSQLGQSVTLVFQLESELL